MLRRFLRGCSNRVVRLASSRPALFQSSLDVTQDLFSGHVKSAKAESPLIGAVWKVEFRYRPCRFKLKWSVANSPIVALKSDIIF
ncbi:hypothetical protein TNCV_83181 [Trichonephila clavipes]|nr:hypothetical protein TNCV_83181 [Trichonephila clavipes]